MKFRQTNSPPEAAAKASFNSSTAVGSRRICVFRRKKKSRQKARGRIRWPTSSAAWRAIHEVLLAVMGFFLVAVILSVGALTGLHSLLERMAHKSQKLQFEFVAVLGQISLFTGMNAFWIASLLLALIDIPDFGTPLLRSRIG